MDFNKLTIKSQEAVAAAQELARRNGNPELYPEHLLLALLDQELPRQLVPDADTLRAEAEVELAQRPRIQELIRSTESAIRSLRGSSTRIGGKVPTKTSAPSR